MRILPRHYWEGREFSKTTLDPPLGSGPYRIDAVDPGRSITYRRVPGNWDEALPVQVGQHNFDVIRYDYYRDETVAIEALKAGKHVLSEVVAFNTIAEGVELAKERRLAPPIIGWCVPM